MGEVSEGAHHSVVVELFSNWHKSEFLWHFYLHVADVSFAAKMLYVVIMSMFDAVSLTERVSKTGYLALTCSKMSSDLFIQQACSMHSDYNVTLI